MQPQLYKSNHTEMTGSELCSCGWYAYTGVHASPQPQAPPSPQA